MWRFSIHAKIRIEERGYSSNEILKVLQEEVPSIILHSPREESVDLYFSLINSKYLLIVVDRIDKSIITVRPMRKKEKVAFIKEIEHG